MAGPPLREAATVVLVRDGADGPEVCLLRRTADAVFAPGAHVFPGGALDPADHALVTHAACAPRSDEVASRALGVERGGLAYWIAAVRECFEEAGVLLARRVDGRPLELDDPAVARRFAEHRRALTSGELTLAALCEAESLVLELDAIFYLSHWITPPGAPRRYDTRFFVAAAPESHVVVPDGSEVVADLWCRPHDALRRHAAGEVDLILPTARSLEVLARFESTTTLVGTLAAAEASDGLDGPTLVDDWGGRRRLLPGDEPLLAGAGPAAPHGACS